MIKKHPQNGSSKGISIFLLAAGPQGRLMKTQFGRLWRSNIYQLFLFLSIAWNFFTILLPNPTGIVETADTRLCTGKISEPTTVEKMDRSSCVGVGKGAWWNSV